MYFAEVVLEEGLFHWTEVARKGISDRSLLKKADMKSRVTRFTWADVQWEIIL